MCSLFRLVSFTWQHLSFLHFFFHGARWLICFLHSIPLYSGFPGGSVVKNPPVNAGDVGSMSGSGKYPGERNGNPFQYSCLGDLMDRGSWQATVRGVTKELDMT